MVRLESLKKSSQFKKALKEKKIHSEYFSIFAAKNFYKPQKRSNLLISFVMKKKIGNAVKRNKIKRRLKNMVRDICKKIKINLNYSYLIIAKKKILEDEFQIIKEELFNDFKKTKKI